MENWIDGWGHLLCAVLTNPLENSPKAKVWMLELQIVEASFCGRISREQVD